MHRRPRRVRGTRFVGHACGGGKEEGIRPFPRARRLVAPRCVRLRPGYEPPSRRVCSEAPLECRGLSDWEDWARELRVWRSIPTRGNVLTVFGLCLPLRALAPLPPRPLPHPAPQHPRVWVYLLLVDLFRPSTHVLAQTTGPAHSQYAGYQVCRRRVSPLRVSSSDLIRISES